MWMSEQLLYKLRPASYIVRGEKGAVLEYKWI